MTVMRPIVERAEGRAARVLIVAAIAVASAATTAACNAIVGFPERHLDDADARESAAPADASGDALADAAGEDGPDRETAELAALDAGGGCSVDFPDAVFCEEFEGPSLTADGWSASDPDDAGSIAVVATSTAEKPNHVLEIGNPQGTGVSVSLSYSLPTVAGPSELSFDLLATEQPTELVYTVEIDQGTGHALKLYLSGAKTDIQEGVAQAGYDQTLPNVTFEQWHRVQLQLTPAGGDGGDAGVYSVAVDGVSVVTNVAFHAEWTDDPLSLALGYTYTDGDGAKGFAYDNVVYKGL